MPGPQLDLTPLTSTLWVNQHRRAPGGLGWAGALGLAPSREGGGRRTLPPWCHVCSPESPPRPLSPATGGCCPPLPLPLPPGDRGRRSPAAPAPRPHPGSAWEGDGAGEAVGLGEQGQGTAGERGRASGAHLAMARGVEPDFRPGAEPRRDVTGDLCHQRLPHGAAGEPVELIQRRLCPLVPCGRMKGASGAQFRSRQRQASSTGQGRGRIQPPHQRARCRPGCTRGPGRAGSGSRSWQGEKAAMTPRCWLSRRGQRTPAAAPGISAAPHETP